MGKNYRLLDDAHVHLLSSLQFNLGRWFYFNFHFFQSQYCHREILINLSIIYFFNNCRSTLCLEYLSLLIKHMTDPLKLQTLSKVCIVFYLPMVNRVIFILIVIITTIINLLLLYLYRRKLSKRLLSLWMSTPSARRTLSR